MKNELNIKTKKIKSELEQRYEAMIRRKLYTKSKTAKIQAEREEARTAYLDKVSMNQEVS